MVSIHMDEGKESRFESSETVSMFPTFVWKTQLKAGVHQAIDKSIVNTVEEMRRDLEKLRPGEAWQSGQELQRLTAFDDLVSHIHDTASVVLKFLGVSHDGFDITACWATVNAPGASHKPHSHPNNYLSGVYYVQTHEGSDVINFHDPRPQTSIIRPPVTELTAVNTDQVVLKVKNGTLLLFPSWLEHSVPPNRSNEPRISVSFNIMFSAFAEKMSKPLW